jgi:(2Fe-2S) ferredoxin
VPPQAVVVIRHGFSDFDGDGKADPSVFRPSTGVWYMNRSTAGFNAAQLGISTDVITPADFDGDDKTDLAVWREAPAGSATFYILQSSTSTLRIELLGQTGDKAVSVGDWDGDGKADTSVYRDSAVGSQSSFYYRGSLNNPAGNITYLPWGTTGDRPMRGDFDGDGKSDAAIFRPSDSLWYIRLSSTSALRVDNWGLATDKFVPADYDGDSKTDLAVFRNGVWYVKQSSNGAAAYYNWGLATDVLVPADYDGDGKADAAIYRNGAWYIRLSGTSALSVVNFGLTTDRPAAAAFVQ